MANKRTLYGYISIVLAVILWGASFVWSKELLNSHFGVFTILSCRIVIACLALMIIFLPNRKIERIRKGDYKLFFTLALFEPFLYFLGENFGLKYVSSSFAAMIVALIPIFVALTMHFVFKDILKKELIIGVFASIFGVVLMSIGSSTGETSIKGVLLLSLAVLTAAAYTVSLQTLIKRGYSPVSITFWQNALALVYFIPCFFIFDFSHISEYLWTPNNIFNLVCLGVLCSAGAYAFYSNAARLLSITKISIFTNIIPVITIILAVSIGQESLTLMKSTGIVIAVLGVIFSQSSVLSKNKTKSNINES